MYYLNVHYELTLLFPFLYIVYCTTSCRSIYNHFIVRRWKIRGLNVNIIE